MSSSFSGFAVFDFETIGLSPRHHHHAVRLCLLPSAGEPSEFTMNALVRHSRCARIDLEDGSPRPPTRGLERLQELSAETPHAFCIRRLRAGRGASEGQDCVIALRAQTVDLRVISE